MFDNATIMAARRVRGYRIFENASVASVIKSG
jgi:hypothetical protein